MTVTSSVLSLPGVRRRGNRTRGSEILNLVQDDGSGDAEIDVLPNIYP